MDGPITLDDLLRAFGHYSLDDLNEETMKEARRFAQKKHPDFTRQDTAAEFTWFGQAYNKLLAMYQMHVKKRQPVHEVDPEESTGKKIRKEQMRYVPDNPYGSEELGIAEMDPEHFTMQFNSIYEQSGMKKKIDETRNDWFRDSNPIYDVLPEFKKPEDLARHFNEMKKNQSTTLMIRRETRGLQLPGGAKLYEDAYDSDEDEYISSDVFGNLRYEDIRKVHGEQTILSYVEEPVRAFNQSFNEAEQMRADQNVAPMAEFDAILVLEEKQRKLQERIDRNLDEERMRSMHMLEKNKNALNTFRRIDNGAIMRAIEDQKQQQLQAAAAAPIEAQTYQSIQNHELEQLYRRTGPAPRIPGLENIRDNRILPPNAHLAIENQYHGPLVGPNEYLPPLILNTEFHQLPEWARTAGAQAQYEKEQALLFQQEQARQHSILAQQHQLRQQEIARNATGYQYQQQRQTQKAMYRNSQV